MSLWIARKNFACLAPNEAHNERGVFAVSVSDFETAWSYNLPPLFAPRLQSAPRLMGITE